MRTPTGLFPIARCLCLLLPLGAGLGQTPPAADGPPPNLPPGLYAVIHTSMGTITAELYEKETPNTVRNFIGLARGTRPWLDPKTHQMVARPLYDNITFHRVIPDFMIQTGDPTGTGAHNCGFLLKDEIVSGFRFDRAGRLAMANVGQPNTGACQFFITDAPYPSLNGGYTIFGQVVDGQKAVTKIAHVIRDGNDKPRFPVKLVHIDIIRVAAAAALARSASGSGIYVNAAGDILTTAALVQGCTEVRLGDAKLQEVVMDRKNGLAVVHSKKETEAFAVFRGGDGAAAQEPVWLAGPTPTAATVGAVADSHGDNRFLQVTAAAPPGSGGGALLDAAGHVAGIVAAPAEDQTQPGTLAIKASVAMGFLDSVQVAYTMGASGTPADGNAAAEAAGKYTLELQCWKTP